MGLVVKVPVNMFKEVEKMLHYRFWDKERERSQRATAMAQAAQGTRRRCPFRHDQVAWSGPPHDTVRAWVCLRCNAAASEPEIKDRGYAFEDATEDLIVEILDLDLQRQAEQGNKAFFFGGFDAKS